jgi:hypothetical protein
MRCLTHTSCTACAHLSRSFAPITRRLHASRRFYATKSPSALTTPSGTRQKWCKSLILLQSLKSVSHCPTENPLGCSCNLLIYIYLFNKSNSSGTVGHEKKRVYDFVSALLRDWVTTKSLRDRKKQKLIILRVPLSHCPTKIVTLCFRYTFQWDTPLVSHLEPVSHCPTWRI